MLMRSEFDICCSSVRGCYVPARMPAGIAGKRELEVFIWICCICLCTFYISLVHCLFIDFSQASRFSRIAEGDLMSGRDDVVLPCWMFCSIFLVVAEIQVNTF